MARSLILNPLEHLIFIFVILVRFRILKKPVPSRSCPSSGQTPFFFQTDPSPVTVKNSQIPIRPNRIYILKNKLLYKK